MRPPARSPEQRKRDTLERLAGDVDAWVATADADSGTPYLIPLSYLWDGATLLVSTPAASPTSRNLQATRKARVGVGSTRDLVIIEGAAQTLTAEQVGDEDCRAFAARTGFDPRHERPTYLFFRIQPQRIQAWRESNELVGRDLMRDGRWLVAD